MVDGVEECSSDVECKVVERAGVERAGVERVEEYTTDVEWDIVIVEECGVVDGVE